MDYQLIEVIYELTLKCNLNCLTCGSNAGQSRANELSLNDSLKLIRDLSELETRYVVLSGGEFSLNKNWFNIAKAINDYGMKLGFVSNGYDIDKEINKLRKLEIHTIGISIDGDKETHDFIRREGSYERAINNINELKKNEIHTGVITTITKTNINTLEDILFTCIANNIDSWQLQAAVPMGRMRPELTLTNHEYKQANAFINKARTEYSDLIYINGADCMGLGCKTLVSDIPYTGCNAGIEVAGVRANGDVTGCLSIMNDDYIEGNILDKSIKDIWNDPEAFKYNRAHQGVTGKCLNCNEASNCKGGCTSVNIATNGEEHNSPYCEKYIN